MPVMKLKVALRNAIAQLIVDAMNAGAGPGVLKFYTATQPAGPAIAITDQVLLGTLTCSDPAATVTGGVITFDSVTQDSAADATGTATWVRAEDSDGNAVADFDVTNEAGTGAIKINTVSIFAGGPIQMTSFTITMGGA